MTPVPEAVTAFFALRQRWSGTHNLSGPRALQDPETVDLLDARAVVAALAPKLPLYDVGAGSGVPGLLVACLEPHRRVVLVEPLAKRAAFLRTAVHTLGLGNVCIERDRWPLRIAEPVQVVARAVVAPDAWPALALAGGPHVLSVLRCLAAVRPAWTEAGFGCGQVVDYDVGGTSRRIERWDRLNPSPLPS